ncbi:LOW QUALITY PROTEIN: conserved hypothetical protein, partial [Brucella melitensis bv. 2 str. 63/9]
MAARPARHDRNDRTRIRRTIFTRNAAFAILMLSLGGCAMGGFSIEKAVPDASAITGSVQQAESAETDTGKLSDQSAIKNVVSALNFTQWGKSRFRGQTLTRAARGRSPRLPNPAPTTNSAVSLKPRVRHSTAFRSIAAKPVWSAAASGRLLRSRRS